MLTRRQSLTLAGTAAALPLAAALPARAEAPMLGASRSDIRRFAHGNFEVTTMLVGNTPREDPQQFFGINVERAEFEEVSRANFLDPDLSRFFFTPTIVNTGSDLILFDTGLNTPAIELALSHAGYTSDQVDTVVITHMHGDHVGGLMKDGAPTFANASHYTARAEFDFWAGADNEAFEANVRPIADQFTFIEDGADVGTGVTAMSAPGHTPGHMVFRIESAGQNLLLFADLANHPVWSLARPDWHFGFDNDREMAATSRRRVLDMIAAERMPAIGYHMPFPALGHVDTHDGGFRWVPESGQFG